MSAQAPPIEYHPAPCPRCGAATVREAAARCRPLLLEQMDDCPGALENPRGELLQPTPESLAAIDHWLAGFVGRAA